MRDLEEELTGQTETPARRSPDDGFAKLNLKGLRATNYFTS